MSGISEADNQRIFKVWAGHFSDGIQLEETSKGTILALKASDVCNGLVDIEHDIRCKDMSFFLIDLETEEITPIFCSEEVRDVIKDTTASFVLFDEYVVEDYDGSFLRIIERILTLGREEQKRQLENNKTKDDSDSIDQSLLAEQERDSFSTMMTVESNKLNSDKRKDNNSTQEGELYYDYGVVTQESINNTNVNNSSNASGNQVKQKRKCMPQAVNDDAEINHPSEDHPEILSNLSIFTAEERCQLRGDWELFRDILMRGEIYELWHFTHIDNIDSIKRMGGLFSWNYFKNNNLEMPICGSNDLSRSLDSNNGMNQYVHLGFFEYHPMLHKLRKQHSYGEYKEYKIDPRVIYLQSTYFSNKNATASNKDYGGEYDDFKKIRFDLIGSELSSKRQATKEAEEMIEEEMKQFFNEVSKSSNESDNQSKVSRKEMNIEFQNISPEERKAYGQAEVLVDTHLLSKYILDL